MSGFWGDDYWGEHTPGLDCPCKPGHVTYDIPGLAENSTYSATQVFGIRHRGITEEISRAEWNAQGERTA